MVDVGEGREAHMADSCVAFAVVVLGVLLVKLLTPLP